MQSQNPDPQNPAPQNTAPLNLKTPANKTEGGVRLIPVLPVRDTVLFPHAVLPLTVGRESSIQLIESLGEERTIIVAAQLDPKLDTPRPGDLHAVGTLATVHKVVRMPKPEPIRVHGGRGAGAAGQVRADRAVHGGGG